MKYVLVVVTVFSNSQGITSDTRFHSFATHEACVVARDDIERGVLSIKGQMGREVFARCYPDGGQPGG